MAMRYIELLEKLATLNEDEQEALIYQHPVLLSDTALKNLHDELSSLSVEQQEKLQPVLTHMHKLLSVFKSHPTKYPVGLGPIEQLWKRLSAGEINWDHAKKLSQMPEVTEVLSPVYINALCVFNVKSAYRGNLRHAVEMHKLILAAVKVLPHAPEAEEMRSRTDFEWIEIAAISLGDLPDGRIYHSALNSGQRLIDIAKRKKDKVYLGNIHHRLGVLHLDPYTAGRSTTNYDYQIHEWQQRLVMELGEELYQLSEEEWRMPKPMEALRIAKKHFLKATHLRTGHAKGRSLKALTQALWWMDFLGETVNKQKLIKLCKKALKFLDPALEPQHRFAVLAKLSHLGQEVDTTEIYKILQKSLDEYIRDMGPEPTIDLVFQATQTMRYCSPSQALMLSRNARPLFKLYGNEDCRLQQMILERNIIINGLAHKICNNLLKGGVEEEAEKTLALSKKESWDVRKLGASFVSLAVRSSKWNEELFGIKLLDRVKDIAPLFADDFQDPLSLLKAELTVDAAVNYVNSEEWATAIRYYNSALCQFLDLNLTGRTMECLRRIDDLAGKQGANVAKEVLRTIAPLSWRLETELGETASRMVQELVKRTIAALSSQEINSEVFFFLLQVAKGGRFGKAIYAGSRYNWHYDDYGEKLLQQIQELQNLLPKFNSHASEALLDEETLLTAFVRRNDRQYGDSPTERLTNLQHSYDEHLNRQLLAEVSKSDSIYLTTKDVQEALDDRTVLLNYYLGAWINGNMAIYIFAITREEIKLTPIVVDFPDSQVIFGDNERELTLSPFSLTIQSLRKEIVSYPGPVRLVTQEAGESLATALRGYLGSFVEYLADLRKTGKDHICIIPHGPIHYYPLHLIGEVGKPLSDQWIVSYLPNLHLLMSRRGLPAIRRHRSQELSAIGLSFQKNNPFGLAPIHQSLAEATKISNIFRAKPILEEKATENTLIDALRNSRYVHVSTHGRHNVEAPSFQCLYLTPDDQSDGILHACELFSLDLRGLELLTLSACETALGRFDSSDNLRGLPAAFLLSGVSTIIGTLWPVKPDVSEMFFTILYEKIHNNKSLLDSFADAQRETRVSFPQYRDWGAFYMLGNW